MVPSRFHVPPAKPDASPRSFGAPPAASTRFKRPPATKPMVRLSGDQKGSEASSVPPSRRNVVELGLEVEVDDHRHVVEYWRLPYDIQWTQKTMKEAGPPQALIDRLALGR